MDIVASKAIGPFNMYTNLMSIKSLFPTEKIKNHAGDLENGSMTFLEYKGLNISFCNKIPQDIWIDLQKSPKNCLSYKGKKISPIFTVKKMRTLSGGCKTEIMRIGEIFYECGKGLRIGVGSGSSMNVVDQIRIGLSLDTKFLPFTKTKSH
jgi:hypothetical protein